MIRYAIFDMDGTLLDTEKIFQRTWNEVGARWRLVGIEDMYGSVVGRSIDTIILMLCEKYGEDIDFRAFFDERMKYFCKLIEKEVPLKSGCLELLEFLKSHGIPMALATSTPLYITDGNLRKTGIDKYMDAVVTADMVENGKPAPDIFLEAGRRIGAIASECIVCEDSYSGIIAASRAGMKPVMIPDMLLPNEETNRLTYATENSLFDVIELIKKENNFI